MRVLFIGGAGAIAAPMVSALVTAKRRGEKVDIFLLAREGDTLTALQDPHRGLQVTYQPEAGNRKPGVRHPEPVQAKPGKDYKVSDNPKDFGGPMDFIVLGLKATEVSVGKLDELKKAGVIGPNTLIATIQNGVPVWLPLTRAAQNNAIDYVEAVDPGGHIVRKYGQHLVGGFTAAAARQMKEGGKPIAASSLVSGDYPYVCGMPQGSESPHSARVEQFVGLLSNGGLNAKHARDNIGQQSFLKLAGNTALNAISALTNATLNQIATTPGLKEYALEVMAEVREVALALGVIQSTDELKTEKRLDDAGTLTHRPSMWADVNSGKMPEIDALLGAVVEIADHLDMAPAKTKNVRALFHAMEELAQHRLNGGYVRRPMRPWNATPAGLIVGAQQRVQGLPQMPPPAP